jgi:hypothetical protein
MPTGITDLAHSIRKNSAAKAVPIPLSRGQQLVAAALGYQSFASYQAARTAQQEPLWLDNVRHAILDYDLLFERANGLGLKLVPTLVKQLLDTAFQERLPRIKLHASYSGWEDDLREQVDARVIEDDEVNGEMANANYDGIDEVYFELEVPFDQAAVGSPLVIDLNGHVGLGIDTERPYSGHKVNVEVTLTLERLGLHCFAETEMEIVKAALDYGWSDPDPEDENQPPPRTLVQALAEELGIEPFEAEQLADAEAQELTGHSGDMTYGYLFDFADHASPQLAGKLLARNGSLQLEVGPNFFEGIRYDGWPN